MTDENDTKITQIQHIEDPFSQLSNLQWRFITAMVEDPSRTKKDAALHIKIVPDTVYRWPKYVDEALEIARRDVHDAAKGMRKQAIIKAMGVKVKLLNSVDEAIRSRVATEIIEWELGSAIQRQESDNTHDVTFRVTYGDDDGS